MKPNDAWLQDILGTAKGAPSEETKPLPLEEPEILPLEGKKVFIYGSPTHPIVARIVEGLEDKGAYVECSRLAPPIYGFFQPRVNAVINEMRAFGPHMVLIYRPGIAALENQSNMADHPVITLAHAARTCNASTIIMDSVKPKRALRTLAKQASAEFHLWNEPPESMVAYITNILTWLQHPRSNRATEKSRG